MPIKLFHTADFLLTCSPTFATELEGSPVWIAFLQPLQLTASVASGGQPPPLPAGCPLQASLWPNTVPPAWVSAAQHPERPPEVNKNIIIMNPRLADKLNPKHTKKTTKYPNRKQKCYFILAVLVMFCCYQVILEELVSLR